MRNKKILALILTVTLVLGIFIGVKSRKPVTTAFASELTIEPTDYDSSGANLDTNFSIKAKSPLSPKLIKENLTIEPNIEFTAKQRKENKNEVLIVPKEPLEPQSIYRFSLATKDNAPLRWAFQTKGDFKVVSTLPRDKSTGVPVDTGIELTFSHLNFEKLPDYFSITPKVAGAFEVKKKTAVFVPKKLQPKTLYTVKIKKGLPLGNSEQVLEHDFVFQFETKEETQDNEDFDLCFYKDINEFTTGEKPIFQSSNYDRYKKISQLDVIVYQYKSAAEYLKALKEKEQIPNWAYFSRLNYKTDTSLLSQVTKFSTPFKQYNDMNFLEFPEPLSPGFYIAEVHAKDSSQQLWFQVTDLGIYAACANNKTLFWVNDLSTGSPVQGANVHLFDSKATAKTDNTGLAQLTTPDNTSTGVFATISSGKKEAVAAVCPWNYWDFEEKNKNLFRQSFWKYLYTDRNLYKPDDTVHFWGIIKPRKAQQKAPKNVTIALSKTGGWQEDVDIESMEVKIDEQNFTGEMKLPNLSPGYYYLVVRVEDKPIIYEGFEVATYSKPVYEIEAIPDKKAIYAGDTTKFKIKATFFEGTGAANINLNYSSDDKSGSLTTDDKGEAILYYKANYQTNQYSPVQTRNLYFTANMPESGEITGESSLVVLNNDIEIEATGKVKKGRANIDIKLNKLSVDKVNNEKADPWDRDAYKAGVVKNYPINVKVYKEVWEKKDVGQYYDFINKKVQTRYDYIYKKVLENESQVSSDDKGNANFTFAVGNKESYIVELSTKDFRGNQAVSEVYISGPNFYLDYGYPWYYLEDDKPSGKYKDGENVKLIMKKNQAVSPERENGYMFLLARDGILDEKIQNSSTFNTVFKNAYIPNFWVKGVYFDGRYYQETPEFLVNFDEKEKALEIDIKTDKDVYRPGDNVKVDVQVKDKSKKPIKAHVNLNLVDEALYAIRDQEADILGKIYGDFVSSGLKYTLKTHGSIDDRGDGGAEYGGEGGSERKDFKDAVFFKTVVTNNQGKASVQFKVPDNLTSWRLTSQAITGDLKAGTATTKVPVKLPFFVDAVLGDTYLTGDELTVPIRSYGTKIKPNTNVEYKVTLKSGKNVSTKTVSGKVFDPVEVPLGSLKAGKYELSLSGKTADGLSDAITLNFNVVDSMMTKQQTDFYLLDEQLKLKGPADSLINLVFTDYQKSQYLELLLRLSSVSGSRVEQKIASKVADELIQEHFPDAYKGDNKEAIDLLNYQTPEGGIAIFPYADADLELSAKLASLYNTGFDKAAMTDYFEKIANDPKESRERSIIALYGLAALNEPVLQELNVVSGQGNLTVKEQLYLTLALIELGDAQTATSQLQTLLKSKGQDLKTAYRLNAGKDQDDILQATSLAAVAAAELDFSETGKMLVYMLENQAKDVLLYPEQLLTAKKALPKVAQKTVSFRYKLDKEQKKVSIKPGECFNLILTPEKLKSLKFDDIQGQVGVTISYNTPFKAQSNESLDGVKLKRSYTVSGKTSKEFKTNDVIKINIDYEFGSKAPDGQYQITDFLPAGLRIVQRPYYRGLKDKSLGYPVEVDGQKAVFMVYEKKKGSFNYYARVINPGKFRAEQAVMQHAKSGKVYATSESDRIVIK